MNQQPPKPRVSREIPPEWDEVMRLALQIKHGEIVIRVQDGKVTLTEYTVKRKPEEPDELTIFAI